MKFPHNICQGRALTMDCQDYITEPAERKKGRHLRREERGVIQHLKRQGYSNRAIAREIGCSPSTVANELRRGTPPRKSNRGRKPGYSARRGEAIYKANRKHSRRHHRVCRCARFLLRLRQHRPRCSELLIPTVQVSNLPCNFRTELIKPITINGG